jgi:outer membrane protein assembly factor BamB
MALPRGAALVALVAGLLLAGLGCERNAPPSRPETPDGPPCWRTDTLARFTSRADDQNGDSVAIRFSWGNGDTSDWSTLVASGESVTLGYGWSTPDTYLVRAQAKDSRNALSEWSYTSEIIVGLQSPPGVPVWLEGPSQGAPCRLHAFTVEASDPERDSIRYEFDWGDGDTSVTPWTRSGASAVAAHAWAQNETCQLRVRTQDIWGAYSAWSEPYPFVVVSEPGDLVWRYAVGTDAEMCSPAIGSDGIIYIAAVDEEPAGAFLYALNPDSTLRWQVLVGDWVEAAPAIGPDGTIYVAADTLENSHIVAVRPDGTRKWIFPLGYSYYSSPAVGPDGTVYVGADSGFVHAINPDGTLKWRASAGTWGWFSSPAIGLDGTVYIGSEEGFLFAINPDGTPKWDVQLGFCCDMSSPAVSGDGTIYIGADSLLDVGLVCAVNPDGTRKWTCLTEGEMQSSPALGEDGTVYIGCDDGCLYAVNPDGTLKWKYQTDDMIVSGPAIGSDGTVYFGNDYGYVVALAPDGRLVWEYSTGDCWVESSPAIGAEAMLYIACEEDEAYLLAIKCAGALANTAWPKFHHDNRNSGWAAGR